MTHPDPLHYTNRYKGDVCQVVTHPNPEYSLEWYAVQNTQTGEYKLDDNSNAKRYWHKFIDVAVYEAHNDSCWIVETGKVQHLKYGRYEQC